MSEPLVRRVDHVFVPVDDPASLHALFTDTLELPVAWPVRDYGPFVSGGVDLGNCALELVRGDATVNPFFAVRLPAVIRGVAFEPAAGADPAASLAERRLRHFGPFPFEGTAADGGSGLLWTLDFVGGLIAEEAGVFLCRYHRPMSTIGARSARVGVLAAAEVTIGAQDHARALHRWQRFLDPIPQIEPGLWAVGDGPAIRVVASPLDGVAGLTLHVSSLEQARAALAERRLLGPVRRNGVGVNHAALHGLDVWLTEPPTG